MKAVILAGGLGTRISEESALRPKPMIEIGGMPILWHIMKIYSHFGIDEFIICCGYKGYVIKEYFANYFLHMSDVTFNLGDDSYQVNRNAAESWKVSLVDTGENTMTGGRIRRIREYLKPGENFCCTYGDGVSNVNISKLINFHVGHHKLVTVTTVHPPSRFGVVEMSDDGVITSFSEKPVADGGRINGGFFVISESALDMIDGDDTIWEGSPLERLASNGQLMGFKHNSFWQPMDTLRDKRYLDSLWQSGAAPWKIW